MRSIPDHRLSLLVHAALAGALAFSATSLMAENKPGDFDIQIATATPQTPKPENAAREWTDATGHTDIKSPRDAASGQASGVREGGVNDTTFRQSAGTTQPNGVLVTNENVTGARGTATAQTGQWAGGSDDGSSIRRKPPGNRPRKGRRMHKP